MLKFNNDADSPSIGPGFGKWNLSLFDFNSKYARASGRTFTKAARLPLKQDSFKSAISRMWLHTSLRRPASDDSDVRTPTTAS